MIDIFSMSELTMIGLVLFSSFWIFLFNYRTDHKEKYADSKLMIVFDLSLIHI